MKRRILMQIDNGIESPLRRLCRVGILPRRQASLPMAAKMAALHLSQRYHLPQRYVGRGFFPAIRHVCPWRPRWPPYIYLNVIIYPNVM
jgi:hypothetical protein